MFSFFRFFVKPFAFTKQWAAEEMMMMMDRSIDRSYFNCSIVLLCRGGRSLLFQHTYSYLLVRQEEASTVESSFNRLYSEKITMKMKLLVGGLVVALLLAVVATATGAENEKECIQLCGCPTVSACPNLCGTFELGKCQPFYQCFLPENGLFGHVLPVGNFDAGGNNIITVNVYDDAACTQLRFTDPASVGWAGSCDATCWGPDTSKIGARACHVCSSSSPPSSITKMANLSVVLLLALAGVLFQKSA